MTILSGIDGMLREINPKENPRVVREVLRVISTSQVPSDLELCKEEIERVNVLLKKMRDRKVAVGAQKSAEGKNFEAGTAYRDAACLATALRRPGLEVRSLRRRAAAEYACAAVESFKRNDFDTGTCLLEMAKEEADRGYNSNRTLENITG